MILQKKYLEDILDGNKRTAIMIYMILTTKKSYEEILNDYYDLFLSLAK
jgi:hypothetical protein